MPRDGVEQPRPHTVDDHSKVKVVNNDDPSLRHERVQRLQLAPNVLILVAAVQERVVYRPMLPILQDLHGPAVDSRDQGALLRKPPPPYLRAAYLHTRQRLIGLLFGPMPVERLMVADYVDRVDTPLQLPIQHRPRHRNGRESPRRAHVQHHQRFTTPGTLQDQLVQQQPMFPTVPASQHPGRRPIPLSEISGPFRSLSFHSSGVTLDP